MMHASTASGDVGQAKQYMAQSISAIGACDWEQARNLARRAAAEFEAADDVQGLFQSATVLEKLRNVVEAARLLSIAGRLRAACPLPEWDGTSLRGRTLLVVQRIRDIGAPIRQARVLADASVRAGRGIVLANRRLVPLLRRSYPGLQVRSDEDDSALAWRESDVVASYETLIWRCYRDDASLARSFSALHCDAGRVAAFVRAHRGDVRLRVGLSWFSTNRAKDVPPLSEWIGLMGRVDATYVSLQYGDVAADCAAMRSGSGRDLIVDASVEQLQDIDRYAAQVAALDVVVTISNTLAQLAGALGVRTIVLLDDKLHLIWPVRGHDCSWYPRTTLVHRKGREWSEVFDQVCALLAADAC